MRFNDAVFGFVLIAFALAEIGYTTTFPSLFGQDYGPNLFPILIGLGLLACGVVLVVKGMAERASVPMVTVGDWAQDNSKLIDVGLLIGGIIFYVLVSTWLGFILTALVITALLLYRLGTGLLASFLLALLTTLVMHSLFAKLLLVPLPWGILLPIAW